VTVDTVAGVHEVVAKARRARHIAVDTETIIDPASPQLVDPLRSTLVAISIAVAPGEAYYLPLRHRPHRPAQGDLLIDASGDRAPTDAPEDRGLVRGGDDAVDDAARSYLPERRRWEQRQYREDEGGRSRDH